MSDTPRTDAHDAEHAHVDPMTAAYAASEFARTLEHELAEAKRKLEIVSNDISTAYRIGYELTPDCQTVEEMTTELCRLVREARASRPEVVQISRDDLLRAIVQYMKMQRTDMNSTPAVKLPGQDEVLDKLAAIKCGRREA